MYARLRRAYYTRRRPYAVRGYGWLARCLDLGKNVATEALLQTGLWVRKETTIHACNGCGRRRSVDQRPG
jgi:hypothetical protein